MIMEGFVCLFLLRARNFNGIGVKPEKRADISNASIGFSREMKFEERLQKFHTDYLSFPRSGLFF